MMNWLISGSGLSAQQIRSRLPPARQVRSGNQGRLKVLSSNIIVTPHMSAQSDLRQGVREIILRE